MNVDPDRYLRPGPDAPRTAAGAPQRLYTCPMHPQVRRAMPGACPICGMALEPLTASAEGADPELSDMTRRLVVAAVLSLPLLILEMGADLAPVWQFALATPVVWWTGWPLLARAWISVQTLKLNMFSLIGLGVGASYCFSVVATFAPGWFPAALHRPGAPVPVYYESASVITTLVLLGQVLELRARRHTGSAIRALLKLAPKVARRVHADGREEELPLGEVRAGDQLRIRPGDSVPVDGVVLAGRSAVDESMVTGESLPVPKEAGAMLIGGTINGTGTLLMRADKVGSETMLARIVQMVSEAQRSRAPIQRLADRVAAWFVPAVIGVAILAFTAWLLFGPPPALAFALLAAVSVLIVACPCALGLATPMSIMVGVGRGAAAGVLVRHAESLERLESIDTLVVDKTGTLTEGRPRVAAILPAAGFDAATVLQLTASLERASEHPLAAAMLAAAHDQGLALLEVSAFDSLTGKGVTGTIGGRRVAAGNASLLAALGIDGAALDAQADSLRREGATSLCVAIDGRPAGIIAVRDPIKANAAAALESLRREGIRVVMLTGDHRATAQAVGASLGITDIEAEVLPQQKDAIVRRLRGAGRRVAMAGDGVNDAPALAQADVGIAMGTGTDVAMHSAGITLVKGDLAGIVRARALSRATMANIRQNLALAFVYNVLGIPLAAGVLYPAFGLLLSPVIAAAAMSLSSVSVIANALRLRGVRLGV